jgi:hypothetical protein
MISPHIRAIWPRLYQSPGCWDGGVSQTYYDEAEKREGEELEKAEGIRPGHFVHNERMIRMNGANGRGIRSGILII